MKDICGASTAGLTWFPRRRRPEPEHFKFEEVLTTYNAGDVAIIRSLLEPARLMVDHDSVATLAISKAEALLGESLKVKPGNWLVLHRETRPWRLNHRRKALLDCKT